MDAKSSISIAVLNSLRKILEKTINIPTEEEFELTASILSKETGISKNEIINTLNEVRKEKVH